MFYSFQPLKPQIDACKMEIDAMNRHFQQADNVGVIGHGQLAYHTVEFGYVADCSDPTPSQKK